MQVSNNMRGAAYMVLAMAGFAGNDALVKSLTGEMNVGQIMLVRGMVTTVLVYGIAHHMGALRPIRQLLQPLMLLRIVFEILAGLAYMSALALMPLANASSIAQSVPLAVTLGAALFLGEPVGWRRWSAIIVGFIGVLIIIRPGADGFTTAALLVVGSVFATAGRDLVTRRIHTGIPSLTITLITAASVGLFGAVAVEPLGGWHAMSTVSLFHLFLASLLVLIGYQSVIQAMRAGEISFVAPFRYASLIWATGLGMVFFSERPDIWTLIGSAIVIGSGLYTFYRESRRKRTKPVAQQASVSL